MFIKPILGVALGSGLGAAIGYSQLLCPDGQCQITGSWYGGALFGGILGMALIGAIDSQAVAPHSASVSDAPDTPADPSVPEAPANSPSDDDEPGREAR